VQTLSRGSDYGGGCLPWLYERSLERYLICDVIWSKGDSYRHNVWRLTKAGRRYERGGHTWLSPSSRIRMTQCGDVLPEQPERHCASFDGTQMHSLKEPATEGTSTISLNGCRSERLEELERSTYRLFVCVVRTKRATPNRVADQCTRRQRGNLAPSLSIANVSHLPRPGSCRFPWRIC